MKAMLLPDAEPGTQRATVMTSLLSTTTQGEPAHATSPLVNNVAGNMRRASLPSTWHGTSSSAAADTLQRAAMPLSSLLTAVSGQDLPYFIFVFVFVF